jgi:monoterpene epsilon-lactone hydrolase
VNLHRAGIGVAILVLMALVLSAPTGVAFAQDRTTPHAGITVSPDGTVEIPAQSVPMSIYLSPEAQAYVTTHLQDMQNPQMLKGEAGVPRFMKPYLDRDHEEFPLDKKDTTIAGVHAFIYTPKAGVSPKNKKRVLIDLHGGGFSGCWPACAELESIPVSFLGQIEVISLDYREAPANKFPAASEDVATVYRELLKTHKAKEIGIYGCSAGGMLTAESMAWFQSHSLPSPGAIGILCASASGTFGGDSSYTANWLGEARTPAGARGSAARGGPTRLGYFDGANMKDPLISPVDSPDMLAKFPPTLVVTGTRGFEMSSAVYTHSQLVKAGVDAELHVWEGLFHGFFYNTDVPESKDCFNVILKFFDQHLAQ